MAPRASGKLAREGWSLTRVRCSVTECVNHDGNDCQLEEVRIGVQFNTLNYELTVNGLSTGYPGAAYITTVCEEFRPR